MPALQSGDVPRPGGLAADVAVAAAREGARVELVGRVGDDAAGDAVLLALARAAVGHVAVLRDAGRATRTLEPADSTTDEPPAVTGADEAGGEDAGSGAELDPGAQPTLLAADLELGLRYLTDFGVLVVAEPLTDEALRVVVDAAAFAGANLVVIVPAGSPTPAVPDTATVLEAPPDDADGTFAGVVGAYAAALDRGLAPSAAFGDAVRRTVAEPTAS